MAKLYFRYSSMNAGKSSNLLQTAFNYNEQGYDVLMFTSGLDDRYGVGKITSRIGINSDAIVINQNDNKPLLDAIEKIKVNKNITAIFVDECQFLNEEQVDILGDIVDNYGVTVFCYGIRTDFQTKLFSGSMRLFEIADVIEELRNICKCGKKAICNVRLINSDEKVVIGGNDVYTSMCRHCYKEYYKSKGNTK